MTDTTPHTPIPLAPLTLTQRIDADEGLKAKRKLLSVVSLILLAIVFSGAKVVEANTFIMKISFTNQSGITYLLLLSIIFLMIRYYNYARPYHDELYDNWTNRMLDDHYFYFSHPYEDDISGTLISRLPEQINYDSIRHEGGSLVFKYKCLWGFRRKFTYIWANSNEDDYQEVDIWIGWDNYFKTLKLEANYQIKSYFTHRENLDIFSPYLLGAIAMVSFIFSEEITTVLKGFTP